MDIVIPLELTDATLTSSTVSENDSPEWAVATPYTSTDIVMVTTNVHRNYEALKDNQGIEPWTDQLLPPFGTNGSIWLDLGRTNRWLMFDNQNFTQTAGTSNTITVEVELGTAIDTISILHTNASSVQIRMAISPGVEPIFDETYTLTSLLQAVGYYNWYFSETDHKEDAIFPDLPSYPDGDIEVIVSTTSGNVLVGQLLFGASKSIGTTTYGTHIGITDFSRKVTNAFGVPDVTVRGYAKNAEFAITVPTTAVDAVQILLAQIRSKSVLWIGAKRYTSTIVYGFYRDFDIVLSNETISECSISVEGLV